MRRDIFVALASSATVTALVLAGCSGNSQYGSPTAGNVLQRPSLSMPAAAGMGMTYVAQSAETIVYGFKRDNRSNEPAVCTVGPLHER